MIARFLDAEWARLGRPDPFTVVDAGAGPGTLARAVVAAAPSCTPALRYVAVEVAAAQRAAPPRRRRVARRPAGGAVRRRRPGQRAARQPAVPPRRVRRRLARVVRHRRRRRDVRRGAAGADRAPAGVPARAGRPRVARAAAGRPRPSGSTARDGSCGGAGSSCSTTPARARRSWSSQPWRSWLRTYRGHEQGAALSRRVPAIRTSPPTSRSTSCPNPTSSAARPSSCSAGASTSSSPRVAERGRGAARTDLAALAMRSRVREAEALLDQLGPRGLHRGGVGHRLTRRHPCRDPGTGAE